MAEVAPADEKSYAGPPIVVNGIPIGAPELGIDAVPLLDAEAAGVLAAVNDFTIKQRVQWMEAITQGCVEQANVYDVFDAANGNHLFVAMEKSGDCARCCCAPHHSLFVEFKTVANMNNTMRNASRAELWAVPTAMTMEREGCFKKACLGCCICAPMCADGMFLHAGSVDVPDDSAGTIKAAGDKCARPRRPGRQPYPHTQPPDLTTLALTRAQVRRLYNDVLLRNPIPNPGSPDGGRAGTSSTPGDGSTAVLC